MARCTHAAQAEGYRGLLIAKLQQHAVNPWLTGKILWLSPFHHSSVCKGT